MPPAPGVPAAIAAEQKSLEHQGEHEMPPPPGMQQNICGQTER